MGNFLDKPKTEKANASGSAARGTLRYALASMQGWRVEMEDAHVARSSLPEPFGDMAFFAVFDGHAGARIAKHAAQHLLDSILHSAEVLELAEELRAQSLQTKTNADENVKKDYCDGSDISDSQLSVETSSSQPATPSVPGLVQRLCLTSRQADLLARGMKSGILTLDSEMRSYPQLFLDNEHSGSTAICALIAPTHIFVSNLGDSRAVLSRGDKGYFASEDHKPSLPRERDRIVSAGGTVIMQRVNASLAVSRALGDYDYKNVPGLKPCDQLVSPEPDIYTIEREPPCTSFSMTGALPFSSTVGSDRNTVDQRSLKTPVSRTSTDSTDSPCLPSTPVKTVTPVSPGALSPKSQSGSQPLLPTTPTGLTSIASSDSTFLTGRDEFLILACDGIFDVMSNQELCDFVRSRLRVTNRLETICNQILDSCLSKGSRDNMSIIIITFPGAPQVSRDAIAQEEQFEFFLKERIREIASNYANIQDVDVDYVWHSLQTQEIPGSPPGVGLHAALGLIESTLDGLKASKLNRQTSSSPTATSYVRVITPTTPGSATSGPKSPSIVNATGSSGSSAQSCLSSTAGSTATKGKSDGSTT